MSSLHLESLPMHHAAPKYSIYNDKDGKIIFFQVPLRFSIQEKHKDFLTMCLAKGDNVFMY